MDITLQPRQLRGKLKIIPSKSQAHRLLICAAFADRPTLLRCPETSLDIQATAACLRALGAQIHLTEEGYSVTPAVDIPPTAILPCGESGSTLRFLLPVVGALGVDATFLLEGRLPQRPLSPLWEELERMGCQLSRPTAATVRCIGKLKPGHFSVPGNVSSQYITGLLLALVLLGQESSITVAGQLESAPYVDMTLQALSLFGVEARGCRIPAGQKLCSPGYVEVEGDWSNAAFFLAAQHLGSPLQLQGLNEHSCQGDRAITSLLPLMAENHAVISAKDIPDLVPILAVFAAHNQGAVFTDIQRLRLKESDRVRSTAGLISALGGTAYEGPHKLTIMGTGLRGGTVDACNDHRIAMAAAIASTVCREPVTVLGAQCVTKSYPRFWNEFQRLGGHYEQHLRK